jgi:hypothetical protein
MWGKTFGGSRSDRGYSVRQATDGGYIIVGDSESFGTGLTDVYLIKTDANGHMMWSKTFGGGGLDGGYSVQQSIDGGYIIVGDTESFGAGDRDVYLIKTDARGNEMWSKTFGGEYDEGGRSVKQITNNGYIIVGYTESFTFFTKARTMSVSGLLPIRPSSHEEKFWPLKLPQLIIQTCIRPSIFPRFCHCRMGMFILHRVILWAPYQFFYIHMKLNPDT